MNIQSSSHSLHFWFAGVFTVCPMSIDSIKFKSESQVAKKRKKMSENQLDGERAMISVWSLINDVLEVSWFQRMINYFNDIHCLKYKQDTYRFISLFCLQLTLLMTLAFADLSLEFVVTLFDVWLNVKLSFNIFGKSHSTNSLENNWMDPLNPGHCQHFPSKSIRLVACSLVRWRCWQLDKQGHRSYRNNENCFEKQIV